MGSSLNKSIDLQNINRQQNQYNTKCFVKKNCANKFSFLTKTRFYFVIGLSQPPLKFLVKLLFVLFFHVD